MNDSLLETSHQMLVLMLISIADIINEHGYCDEARTMARDTVLAARSSGDGEWLTDLMFGSVFCSHTAVRDDGGDFVSNLMIEELDKGL